MAHSIEASLMSSISRNANELNREYQMQYSQNNQPENVGVARERMVFLGGLRDRYIEVLKRVNEAAKANRVPERILKGIKKPLTRPYQQLVTEMKFIIDWLKERGEGRRTDIYGLILRLADLLAENGIALSEDDEKEVRAIREDRNS